MRPLSKTKGWSWISCVTAAVAFVGIGEAQTTQGPASKLVIDGKPYEIHGVTYSAKPNEEDFKRMVDMGVNTVRTWGTSETTPELLDMAQKYRVKVMLGIWMRYGKPSMEGGTDRFDWVSNGAGKKRRLDSALELVAKYKDHPALFGWGIGNEVALNLPNEQAKVAYAQFLELLCQGIKKIDPKHPLASVSAWTSDVPYWQKYCPSLDLYGITAYGYGALAIPEALKKLNVDKPFFLGEFGIPGEWEMDTDANGVKKELSDQTKYEIYFKVWNEVKVRSGTQMVGGFLFNFGNHLDFSGVRMGFFVKDCYRPNYWGARQAFTGLAPINALPTIDDFKFVEAEKYPPKAGGWIKMAAKISDKENAPVSVSFYYNQRTGNKAHRNAVKELVSKPGSEQGTYEVQLPSETGPTKVYIFAQDDYPNLSIATASLIIGK